MRVLKSIKEKIRASVFSKDMNIYQYKAYVSEIIDLTTVEIIVDL
jgi:hypothetical protein